MLVVRSNLRPSRSRMIYVVSLALRSNFCIINILEFEGLPSEEIFFDQRKFADDTDGRH